MHKYLEDCLLNSFASPLSSITIDAAGLFFYYNLDLSFLKSIDISKTWVEIWNSKFDTLHHKDLAKIINSFLKANTIKFVKSEFGIYEKGNEEIKFEGIEVKSVVFDSCSFKSTDVTYIKSIETIITHSNFSI